jgi:capsular polysaccharide biosynthesis protein
VSEQNLGLRSSLQIVKRHKIVIGVVLLLGLIAGGGYGVAKPPTLTSTALVVLPYSVHSTATQVVIADSDPVLAAAARRMGSLPVQTFQSRVRVDSLTANVLSITAQGPTAQQAEDIANAVASSYIAYVGAANGPTGQVQAHVLERATTATGTTFLARAALTALMGALAGALAGAIIALAMSRGDRRLRERDEIADAIGVSVLASIQVSHPSDPADWVALLEGYEPSAVEAWRLRSTLHHLGVADRTDLEAPAGTSVAVLSLSRDRGALAIGPQLAAFAASLGIPTTLVFGPQQDLSAAATLRAACVSRAKHPRPLGNLLVAASDLDDDIALAEVGLTVVISVVDDESPHAAVTLRTTETILGVSSGAATAEQLARMAAHAAADGRYFAGILVADPDPADRTTGRLPQLARGAQRRMPTRVNGRSAEIRL